MSAKHALLGLLLDRPAYSYDLGNRLQERLGPAWKVNSGQLSQIIKMLAAEGLVERVKAHPGADERRKIVAITPTGKEEFERWFERNTEDLRLARRPLLLKITLAGPKRLQEAFEQIDAYERDCAARLSDLMNVSEEMRMGTLIRADRVLLRLNLRAYIRQVEGELAWARDARETVEWLLTGEAVWPSAGQSSAKNERARQEARSELFGDMAARDPRMPSSPRSSHDWR